jgi:hypothetical protein
MSRLKSHKVLTTSALAALLFCAPIHLAAQEREAPTVKQLPAPTWLSGLWSELTVWFTEGAVAPKPAPPRGVESTDGGGCLDPNGRCGG